MGKGQTCSTTDPCQQCSPEFACTNGVCTQSLTKFTPGCSCVNNSQCLSGLCGSSSSVCLGTGLYTGSSCQFSSQCQSGWCLGGTCRGYTPADGVSSVNSCGNNNDCAIGQICSTWGVSSQAPYPQCHDLSDNNGFCYSTGDCKANYGHLNPQVECVNGGSGVGYCTPLPGENGVCGTSTTPSQCAYYSDTAQYTCNTSTQPPRCVKGVIPIAVGQPCTTSNIQVVTPCVPGAFCNTNQPNQGFQLVSGTCQNINTVSLGGNCSDLSLACANPNSVVCKVNATTQVYSCQTGQNSVGRTCNYTNVTADSIQCPSDFATLYCACNSLCSVQPPPPNTVNCGTGTIVNYETLLNNFPNTAGYAEAMYSGNRHYLADALCCFGCGSPSQLAKFASQTGVVVDCQAKTITAVKICDNTYTNVPYLQNCNKYVGAVGGASMAHVSIATAILSIATFFAIF